MAVEVEVEVVECSWGEHSNRTQWRGLRKCSVYTAAVYTAAVEVEVEVEVEEGVIAAVCNGVTRTLAGFPPKQKLGLARATGPTANSSFSSSSAFIGTPRRRSLGPSAAAKVFYMQRTH